MQMQNYLMIQNNVVTNVCVWDGNTDTWTPPFDTTMLVQETTPALVWKLVNDDFALTEVIGAGGIGFSWDGTKCVTNEPKPETPVQPTTAGTQDL